jgi:hypothetical protein
MRFQIVDCRSQICDERPRWVVGQFRIFCNAVEKKTDSPADKPGLGMTRFEVLFKLHHYPLTPVFGGTVFLSFTCEAPV